MKDNSIEMVIIFSEIKSSSLILFEYFNTHLPKIFDIEFHEFSFSTTVKKRIKVKSLKYKEANIKKYYSEITTDTDSGFELLTYLETANFKYRDILLSVSYNPKSQLNDDSSVIFTINEDYFYNKHTIDDLIKIYLQTITFLKRLNKEINYGFIFIMKNLKNPALFVMGIGNPNLSKEEEKDIFLWANNNNKAKYKMWRIFWGNLITSNHLKMHMSIDDIRIITGDRNFYKIDKDTYFFNLPDDNLLYGKENVLKKNKLTDILNFL